MIDAAQLANALDLWLCMWEPDERKRYETAVLCVLSDASPPVTRFNALALSHVIASPRLMTAAARVADAHPFGDGAMAELRRVTTPLRQLLELGCRLRGNLIEVELLLSRFLIDALDRQSDTALDWIDVRDLVAVSHRTRDARRAAEIERRIAKRGKYQRGRAANVLGVRVPTGEYATVK